MKATKEVFGILTISLGLAVQVQAQFLYTTNNATIAITGYADLGGEATIWTHAWNT